MRTVPSAEKTRVAIETLGPCSPLAAGPTGNTGALPDGVEALLFDPPAETFAIIDAARLKSATDQFLRYGLKHSCLFTGETGQRLAASAPWLVKLDRGSSFVTRLFTKGKATWHFWDQNPAIFLQSRLDFDSLWRHLRRFTKLPRDEDNWMFLRFWEPAFLEALPKICEDGDNGLAALFGRANTPAIEKILWIEPDQNILRGALPETFGTSTRSRPQVTPGLLQALAISRRRQFAQWLERHLTTRFGALRQLAPQARLDFSDRVIASAAARNITRRGAVTQYAELCATLGTGCATDPMYPWIGRLLGAMNPNDELSTSDQIHREFATYLANVHGPGNSGFAAAIRRVAQGDWPADGDIPVLLNQVFPEKVAHLGPEVMARVLQSYGDGRLRLVEGAPQNLRAFVLASFLFGHQWAQDPLFAEISAPLRRPDHLRSDQLQVALMAWTRRFADMFKDAA